MSQQLALLDPEVKPRPRVPLAQYDVDLTHRVPRNQDPLHDIDALADRLTDLVAEDKLVHRLDPVGVIRHRPKPGHVEAQYLTFRAVVYARSQNHALDTLLLAIAYATDRLYGRTR